MLTADEMAEVGKDARRTFDHTSDWENTSICMLCKRPEVEWASQTCKEFFDDGLAVAQLLLADVLFVNCRRYADIKFVKREGVDVPSGGIPMADTEKYYEIADGPLQEETLVLFVSCNDVFAWACADAEAIAMDELPSLYQMWRTNTRWGATRWCALKRRQRPQRPVIDAMRKDNAWTSDLEALPE